MKAPLPLDEAQRLASLHEYAVLDTPGEACFDDLTELAARICEAPIALISLIDENRQWFKSRVGLDAAETTRDIAFCAHAIQQKELFIVPDATQDVRFADNPLVMGQPGIRFYAGAPLVTPEGHALGTLCVIDREPRVMNTDHQSALRVLSRLVMTQLALRQRTLEVGCLRQDSARLTDAEQDVRRLLETTERSRLALLSVLEDQKQVEETLRESEKRFRLLFERNPAPMLVYERASLKLLAVNEAFLRQYGYSGEEALALLLPDLYPVSEKAAIVALIPTLHGHAYVGEWHHLRKDGTLVDIVAHSHDIDFEGRAARIAVLHDITERKQVENQVLQLNTALEQRVVERTAQLQAINKELESFAYSVSHDLKAPLRGIDGYSRLLLEDHADQLDKEGSIFLGNIRSGAKQMAQLIEDLLAYSRIERRTWQPDRLDLLLLVETTIAERATEIAERGVIIKLDISFKAVVADRDGLAMALRNLLDNALKFTRDTPQPTIEIGVRHESGTCILWVRDNGIGFDMKFNERIFEIFQRLHLVEDFSGTGIGLAIVRKALQRMGGRAWAESTPGQGATFYLELPA